MRHRLGLHVAIAQHPVGGIAGGIVDDLQTAIAKVHHPRVLRRELLQLRQRKAAPVDGQGLRRIEGRDLQHPGRDVAAVAIA